MKEDFLHFIWKFGLFDKEKSLTVNGELLKIISTGQHNTDAGPDFFNAKIKIDDTVWAGNVEIHHAASDWERHGHDSNKAYDNVILHVVEHDDKPAFRSTGESIPTFILRYDKSIEQRYQELLQSSDWIACATYIHEIDLFRIKHFLGRVLVERMEHKIEQLTNVLVETNNNWQAASFPLLFRAFGFSTNALPFELLAKATPSDVIGKCFHSVQQMEALLFGQSGMLQGEATDEYTAVLQKEYDFLRVKFSLVPIDSHLWKFLRLRPSNFPTIRIAQLAQLLCVSKGFSDRLLKNITIDETYKFFDIQASKYWDTHYVFGKTTSHKAKALGKSSIQRIIMNVVSPLLLAYGRHYGDEGLCETALRLLEMLPPEKNRITEDWQKIGLPIDNAFYAQALLQLKSAYCNEKRCLSCVIGLEKLSKK